MIRWWLLLAASLVAAVCVTVIPAWLIQPFRAQTPGMISVAYTLRTAAVAVSAISAAMAVWAFTRVWRRSSRWKKGTAAVALSLTLLCFWFSQENHFEWMYRPLDNPAYVRAHEADFIDDQDMVLAVEINGESAAYPVHQLAYHHLVHDVVGGMRLVATY